MTEARYHHGSVRTDSWSDGVSHPEEAAVFMSVLTK